MSSQFSLHPDASVETATSASANIIPTMPCCSHCTGYVTPQWAGCEASENRCIRATCLPWLLHWVCSLKPFAYLHVFSLHYGLSVYFWIAGCELCWSKTCISPSVSQVLYWVQAMLETSGQALSLLPTLGTTAQGLSLSLTEYGYTWGRGWLLGESSRILQLVSKQREGGVSVTWMVEAHVTPWL